MTEVCDDMHLMQCSWQEDAVQMVFEVVKLRSVDWLATTSAERLVLAVPRGYPNRLHTRVYKKNLSK